MKIVTDSPNCKYCESKIETLCHIFLECTKTIPLILNLENCIRNNYISDYSDVNKLFYITCSHENPFVNYVWATFKHYISRCFQYGKEPSMRGIKIML